MKKLFLLISFLTTVLLQNQTMAQQPVDVSIGYTNGGMSYSFYPLISILTRVASTVINY